MTSLRDRFDRHWVGEPNTGCHLWVGAFVSKAGGPRGVIRANGKSKYSAQRLAYELNVGPIEVGLFVLHKCDVSLCVNPKHLYLGTQKDNVADCIARGRFVRGEKHSNSKLCDELVRLLTIDQRSQHKIAREIGVSQSLVSMVKRGIAWSHVSRPQQAAE